MVTAFLLSIRTKFFLKTLRKCYIHFESNSLVYLLYRFFDPNNRRRHSAKLMKELTFEILGQEGEKVELNLSEHVDYRYFFNGFFDDASLYLLKRYFSGSDTVFIDVGANVGLVSLPVLKNNFRVIAFEPIPQNHTRFMRNLELNPGLEPILFKYAVGSKEMMDKSKTLELFLPPGNTGATSSISDWNPGKVRGQLHTVQLSTLDDSCIEILNEMRVKNVLLKIDVEGMELQVLFGAEVLIQRYKPTILIEWKGTNTPGDQRVVLGTFLVQFGYSAFTFKRENSGDFKIYVFDPLKDSENVLLLPNGSTIPNDFFS